MNYYILYLVSLLICNIFTSICLSRYSLSLYLLFLQLSSYCNIELGLFWLDSRLMVSWGLLRNKHRNTRVGIFADFKLIRFFITFWVWSLRVGGCYAPFRGPLFRGVWVHRFSLSELFCAWVVPYFSPCNLALTDTLYFHIALINLTKGWH